MKFSQFRDVVAVADCGSLRGAARRLNITQPTISRSIHEIEHELGIAIFERQARGVLMTEMGAVFIRRARAVIAEVNRARDEIGQLKGKSTGEVSIALSTTAFVDLMPSALVSFRNRYPDVLIRLSENFFESIIGEVRSGEIDFYVGPIDVKSLSRDFIIEKLFDNQHYIFSRKGHPLSSAKELRELCGAEWIRPTQSRRSLGDFGQAFLANGLPPLREVIHAQSILGVLTTVASTDLLTQLPRVWLGYPPVKDYIVALEGIGPLSARPICLVRRNDLPLPPLAQHLFDLLRRAGANYAFNR